MVDQESLNTEERSVSPRQVQGVASGVEQHPEARHRLSQRAEGEAHPREVLRGELRDHRPSNPPSPRRRTSSW